MPVAWSDEKLILLYCPGRGSNSRPSAHRGFKHEQGVPRPYSLGHGSGSGLSIVAHWRFVAFIYQSSCVNAKIKEI